MYVDMLGAWVFCMRMSDDERRRRAREYQKNWWANATPEQKARKVAKNREYQPRDPLSAAEKRRESSRRYQIKNRATIAQRSAAWRARNRDKVLATRARSKRKHKLVLLEELPVLRKDAPCADCGNRFPPE